jgi:tRNA(Ile)-lysidine synthase
VIKPGLNLKKAVESTTSGHCTDSLKDFDDFLLQAKNRQNLSKNQHINHSGDDSTALFRLNHKCLTRLSEFTKLIVGFSGGLDSTVLLHVLASHAALSHRLTAVHIHHGISANAGYWQDHCEQLCQDLNIPFLARSVQFDRSANLEEGARIARYAVFSSLLSHEDCLLLGHHLDDQAETVLLQLFRGSGIDGMAAMTQWGSLGLGTIARPFLSHSRKQLEDYARSHDLQWIDDESNQEIQYSRNYLRHEIMPLLVKKWPGLVKNIARTAIHCQQAKVNLDALALYDNEGAPLDCNSLFIAPLKKLSFERMTNVLRAWLKKNQVQMPSTLTFQRLIHEVLFASSDANPEVSWNNIRVRLYQQCLYINKKEPKNLPANIAWTEFPSPLILEQFNLHLIARKSGRGLIIPQQAKVEVRFRLGGEHILLHGQTKQLKKLFQQWAIPPWLRETIPLIYINNQLAAVVGYVINDSFYAENSPQAWELVSH